MFGTILEGLRNFGGGGVNTPNPPSVRHWGVAKGNAHVIVFVESVVWRYAVFYRGGGESAIDLFSSNLLEADCLI